MTFQTSPRWPLLRALLPLAFLSFACGLTPPGPANTATPPAGVTTAAGPAATSTAPAATDNQFFDAEVTYGTGPFNLPDLTVGLADLSSYRATLVLTFAGTKGGQPSAWSKTYHMLSTTEPIARQVTIERQLDDSELATELLAEMNGATYTQLGFETCTAQVSVAGETLGEVMEPASFLTGLFGADEAGSESVDGIAADHYTFDQQAMGPSTAAQSTGEVWVATDGGYVLQYRLTSQGAANYFGDGIEGMITWEYALTEINQVPTIGLPANCPPGLVNVPRMPDAVELDNVPGFLSYTTAAAPAEALALYQADLPALGWLPVGEAALTELAAWQDFAQASQRLSVIATTEDGTTTLDVVVVNQATP